MPASRTTAGGRHEVTRLDGAWCGHVGEVVQRLNVPQADAPADLGLHVFILPRRATAVEMAVPGFGRQPLAVFVVEIVEVLDPKRDESIEVNQCYPTLLLRPGLPFRLRREPACGDVDADILIAEHREKGSERHRRISLLHRQGISWAEIAERVGHRSKALTADVYSHVLVDPRDRSGGVALLGGLG